MKTILLGLLISIPVFGDVGPKDVPKDPPKVPEVENVGNQDLQMQEDQIRGTEIEKHRHMEEHMREDLNQPDDDLRMQKDY